MKLEELLQKELFEQVKAAIDAVNAKEPDKLKHIRYADLSEGNYVSKEKYSTLEADKGSVTEQLKAAQSLIEELKKSGGGDETLQGKLAEYETAIETLKKENEALKIESALKLALLDADANVSDIDYLIFKAGQAGELKLGEDGKLNGQENLVSGLKSSILPISIPSRKENCISISSMILSDTNTGSQISRKSVIKSGSLPCLLLSAMP